MTKSIGIDHLASDVPAIVDVGGFTVKDSQDTGGRDRNVFAFPDQHRVPWSKGDTVRTDDIAVVVDAASSGENGSRKVERGELVLCKPWHDECQNSECKQCQAFHRTSGMTPNPWASRRLPQMEIGAISEFAADPFGGAEVTDSSSSRQCRRCKDLGKDVSY